MVYTLHKYILRELLRVFILTTVALTLILSLGSILQPVQEYGAGPRQVVFLMFYFLPITLTFVLPMAALFAGALVYGRFTGDNELDACRASGISITTLVLPGLYLAVFVAIANLILSFYVMPTFVHLAEKSLKADAKQMLFRNIQKKGYYPLLYNNHQILIYADNVDPINDILSGVIVTEVKDNNIKQIYTAENARIKFITLDNTNKVQIRTQKSYQMDAFHAGAIGSSVFSYEFGALLGDDIKFKKIDEMKKIKTNLILFEPIALKAREFYAQLMLELLADDIRKISGTAETDKSPATEPNDVKNYYRLNGEPNSVKFSADLCLIKDKTIGLSGKITAIEYNSDNEQASRTYRCKEASLNIAGDESEHVLEMDIRSAMVEESKQLEMRHVIRNLVPPTSIKEMTSRFKTASGSLDAEKMAYQLDELPGFQPSSILIKIQAELKRHIEKTRVEIKSEIHSRLVFGIGCILMILIGIGLGIIIRGGHLLSAFGISCIPAAVLIVCIMSGKQLTENLETKTVSGVAIMWAGLGILCLFAVAIYHRLLRN
jgi:lipopolysaccharide export LptBFGC system permease protein LptF